MNDGHGGVVLKVGDRVETRVPPYGYRAGIVVSVMPRWRWSVCQYVVEWGHGIGRMEFAHGSGLEEGKVEAGDE